MRTGLSTRVMRPAWETAAAGSRAIDRAWYTETTLSLRNRLAGQGIERLAALSGGIFAVAMTLLVPDILLLGAEVAASWTCAARLKRKWSTPRSRGVLRWGFS